MPKIIDHPRASLQRAMQLAEAVDRLGGSATIESAADSLGNKVSGAFRALISASQKYGVVSLSRGQLKIESLYQDYKLAYTDEQKQQALRKVFLSAPLFASLAKRLDGQSIPSHLEKLIIREYAVPEDDASRVAGYFVEGARSTGLIGSNGNINANNTPSAGTSPNNTTITPITGSVNITEEPDGFAATATTGKSLDAMTVRIQGLGMDEKINIETVDDIDILDAMVKKMRRLLLKKETEARPSLL
jgi:hypothetical protein